MRHFATTGYARVVLVLNRESLDFRFGTLKNPSRIFVDIPRGSLSRRFKIPSIKASGNGGGLISGFRFGKLHKGALRFVVDISSKLSRHNVFALPDPDRIVIDLRGEKTPEEESEPPRPAQREIAKKAPPAPLPTPPIPPSREGPGGPDMELTAKFLSGQGRIVLDPGHGGRDPGAIGLHQIVEKEFVLEISRLTAAALQKRLPPGNRVYLTRNRDRYLPLQARTSMANDLKADLFISIHANSAPHRGTKGIETYLLSEASSARALEVAARESETTIARMTDLQKILQDLMLRSKVNESHSLAQLVHRSMVSGLQRKYNPVKDLGVKRGPFFVLLGAQMPSILIETAFITNPVEAGRGRTRKYKLALAEGIAEGIAGFVAVRLRQARRTR
ncbi:MAG: N-acetylmuramoyl-L-alanine amidase [bacterium]|nr:N-acetylmuramoyl-L-alanine amidase [bacterium]